MTDSDTTPTPAPTIRLDHFLKLACLVETGGRAKQMIQNGSVKVNGEVCLARRKKLVDGDIVHFEHEELVVGIQ